eukprot:m.132313 g.132313  ORF g.132313 m.132313 type:complete len:218 (+) comp29599_c3_seq1:457-1110(+)
MWESAEGWRFKREIKEEDAALALLEGDGAKKKKKGSAKAKKSSGKKSSAKKKLGKKGKGKNDKEVKEPPPEPTLEEMVEKEKQFSISAEQHFVQAIKMYSRVIDLCLASPEGEDHELYISACINIGETYLLAGDEHESQAWVGKAIMMIDTPFRVSGASVVMSKEYIVESGRMWWPALWPEQPKELKKKKAKKGSKKKGSKKKGGKKKKSSKKKKKK